MFVSPLYESGRGDGHSNHITLTRDRGQLFRRPIIRAGRPFWNTIWR
jgi:hypothetical protein